MAQMTYADCETWWYLCDTCRVQHYGAGSMLFGCEKTVMSVKPSTSGRIDPTKLCKHYESDREAMNELSE